ncbi:MAG: outer membrane beta-barrel protein [Acidobacteriota bacterium]
MMKTWTLAAALFAIALPLSAQNWSIGVGSGAFIFDDFVERRMRAAAGGEPSDSTTLVLTAKTRAGFSADLQRELSPRWAFRLEGTFTSAPLAVGEQGSDDSVAIQAGDMDVTTFTVPLVFRINPRGALRFHLMAGPAYAIYRIQGTANLSGIVPIDETRSRVGVIAGAGAAWWLSDRFALEANASDIATASPFEREDFPDVPGFKIPRPHNVHTTLGARWRF